MNFQWSELRWAKKCMLKRKGVLFQSSLAVNGLLSRESEKGLWQQALEYNEAAAVTGPVFYDRPIGSEYQ
ncbi:MAG: hypothetical protein ABID54_00515 [Pseudomonadota bacterium]